MPSPNLFAQFILRRKAFRIPKALIQLPLASLCSAAWRFLRYRLRRLRSRMPFHERRHDRLRRRRWRQRPTEFPPRGPGRRWGWRNPGRVWALPWACRERVSWCTRRPIGGAGRSVRSRCGGLTVVVGGGGSGGVEVFFVNGNGDALAATMPHFSKSGFRSAKFLKEVYSSEGQLKIRFVSSGAKFNFYAATEPTISFSKSAIPINEKSRGRSSDGQRRSKTPARLRYSERICWTNSRP